MPPPYSVAAPTWIMQRRPGAYAVGWAFGRLLAGVALPVAALLLIPVLSTAAIE